MYRNNFVIVLPMKIKKTPSKIGYFGKIEEIFIMYCHGQIQMAQKAESRTIRNHLM
jgi:hypothetical protein